MSYLNSSPSELCSPRVWAHSCFASVVAAAALVSAASLFSGGSLQAQVPAPLVLVAESVNAGASVAMADTTGKRTAIATTGRGVHKSVALDPNDPFAVWGLGSWPTIGSAPIGHYILKGAAVSKKGIGDGVTGAFGRVERCHVFGDQLLITFSSVAPGLYSRPLSGGSAKLVASIQDAFDIAVLHGKVYVTTWAPATKASSLYEVDMSVTPVKVSQIKIAPTAGVAPAVFKAISVLGGEDTARYLLIGSSAGRLWFVDPTMTVGNAFHTTFGSSRGMAEAIATHPDQAIGIAIATSTGVYSQTNYNTGGKPFYTTTNPILDMAVLGGGGRTFGQGCAGKAGEPTHGHSLNSWAYNGNTKFTLEMDGGPANTPGALVIGLSKSQYNGAKLPLSLALIGASKCFLNVSILLQFAVTTDAKGEIVVGAPIPVGATLIGARAFAQWGVFEMGANPAGLTTSKGLELVIR